MGDLEVGQVSFLIPERGKHVGMDGFEQGVREEHRRRGLYTAMLVCAELLTGRIVKGDPENRSPEAQKVWDQLDRPFGNAEPAAEPNPEGGDGGQ
jgi:hypothetical protein